MLGYCLGADIWSSQSPWLSIPFTADLVCGTLLLLITVLLVDEYLKYRDAHAWRHVSAYAIEDLRRVARAIWVTQTKLIDPPVVLTPVADLQRRLATGDGAQEFRRKLNVILADETQRGELFSTLKDVASDTRRVVIDWAPTMVRRHRLAGEVSELTRILRQLSDVLGELHLRDVGVEAAMTDAKLGEAIMAVNDSARAVDSRLSAEIGAGDPLIFTQVSPSLEGVKGAGH